MSYMEVQVNVKLDEKLVKELDKMVESGFVGTKKEAFERAIGELVKEYRAEEFKARINKIRSGTRSFRSVTEEVVSGHEEEG